MQVLENGPYDFDEIWHVARASESKNFFLLTFSYGLTLKVDGHVTKMVAFAILTDFGLFRHASTLRGEPGILHAGAETGVAQKSAPHTPLYLEPKSSY